MSVQSICTSDNNLKCLILGKSGVGKSSLFAEYDRGMYFYIEPEPTDGVNIRLRTVEIDDQKVKLNIWDTGGLELFRTLTAPYHRGADGAILVYDVTDQDSFAAITRWLDDMNDSTIIPKDISLLLVGNKADLEPKRVIKYSQGKELADKLGIPFLETSAKQSTKFNVEQTFISIAVQMKKCNSERDSTDIK